ncbi:MAG: VWA domain-containing protein [Planctomycetota bacterium]
MKSAAPTCGMVMRRRRDRRGAMMVLIVILLPVLFLLAAMAINLSYIQVVRTKVQIVTDASTRAAGRAYVESGSKTEALTAARELAALNPVNSVVIPIAAGDLEYGYSERQAANEAFSFVLQDNANAVRLSTSSFASGSGDALQAIFPAFGVGFDLRPLCSATNAQTTLDVAVIVDRSGSMKFAADESSSGTPAAQPDGWKKGDPVPPNSRWLDLVASVDSFCDELQQTHKVEQVALVSYAADVVREVQLTEDYSQIAASNLAISQAFHGGSTNVGGGIVEGLAAVSDGDHARPWATKVLVVMSDGNHNTGTDPIEAAVQAADQQTTVYTVSFSDEADQATMQTIADMTGGEHYHALDAAQLNEAFRNIAKRLPGMLTQ